MDQDALYGKIGSLIRARRKDALGMTQERLAQLSGISRASIANIETGKQSIFLQQLYSIATALDMSVIDLLPAQIEPVVSDEVRNRVTNIEASDDMVGWIEVIRQRAING